MTPLAWLAGTLLGGIGIDAAAHAGGPDAPWWLWAPTALALLELFLVPSGAWTDTGRRGAVLVRLLAVAAIGTYWVSAVAAGSIGWGGSAPLAILMRWYSIPMSVSACSNSVLYSDFLTNRALVNSVPLSV